jgi:ABC-2 type transport system ATP-binding protein
MSQTLLSFAHVNKFYGQVLGLSDFSLEFHGGVVGLLGRNGAGKTTFIRLASGMIEPDLGTVLVMGEKPRHATQIRARIGVCLELDHFYESMSGLEWVKLMARFSGLSASEAREASEATIDLVGMSEYRKKKIGSYSKGMRQRIKLASALVHDPAILLLDEPLTGLDPVGRYEMVELIRKLGESGRGVLVSSHVLAEVEMMTDELFLIHQGRLMAEGSVEQIRDQMDDQPRQVRILCAQPQELAEELLRRAGIDGVKLGEHEVQAQFRDGGRFYGALTEIGTRIEIEAILSLDSDLEAVFDYLVGGA